MNWFSWLSSTGLEPSLLYEYGLAFAHNELEEEDIIYFNHEFLQSIGISIAKHRLEILKLARKHRGKSPRAMARLMVAIKRTKRSLAKYIKTLVPREESALVVTRSRNNNYGSRLTDAVLKRNKKLMVAKQERLLLTNGSPLTLPGPPRIKSLSSPAIYELQNEEKVEEGEDDEGYWSTALKEIRWDTMFQNLQPT